ncbi:hypothetical protein PR202_ga03982 [Eleusine coracana subsp. coracana]|uniref:F-box/LRR-repeat protein 15/At3g58940/PEG3-like LRR domain-containing protein n=1 Tax=Eleusine coracana subsp. coracana TaxID=191504 RepID=A0AAV5BQH6_ELECO|nr:hypothetical protein PR202_ga03982 [Eleusine coracana subsp. coracana]
MAHDRAPPAKMGARTSPRPQAQPAAAGGGEGGEGADRLSALDDATLHAILARLPLRDAAATSALARRWPRVFATLPRLVLRPGTFNRRADSDSDEDRCEDAVRWMSALRGVLARRAAPVAAFDVEAAFAAPLHDAWARLLFRDLCGGGGLLELGVANTNYAAAFTLPPPVYACHTLTSLDLYNCRLRMPSKVTGLRSVRSLRLRNVVATDAEVRRVILRCAAMERLVIHDVHRARSVVVRAPCLETMEVYSYRPLCVSVAKAPRLHTVRMAFSYGYPECSWSVEDVVVDEDPSSVAETEIEKVPDYYRRMAEKEHEQTDEVKNMVKFLGGLGGVKQLRLFLSTEYAEVLKVDKIPMLKRFPQKSSLPELTTLALTLDYNHEVLANLVSCLLNSSPNLKDLTIIELRHSVSPVPLAAVFWADQMKQGNVLNHLSTVTFYTDSLFDGHPFGGLCRFLVMHSRVLKRMRVEYHCLLVQPEHVAKLEAIRRDLHHWPRASGDVLLELYPVDCCPCF